MGRLNNKILVLDKYWSVVAVTTTKRALSMVYTDVACIVDPMTYDTFNFDSWVFKSNGNGIQCVNFSVDIPDVILLQTYKNNYKNKVSFSRRNLYKRDSNTCQYCGTGLNCKKDLTIDHIMPTSRGGKSTWENCVIACNKCNSYKGDRTPSEAGMKLYSKPRRQNWCNLIEVPEGKMHIWERFKK